MAKARSGSPMLLAWRTPDAKLFEVFETTKSDRLTLTLLGQMHANILRLFYSLWSRKQMALLG